MYVTERDLDIEIYKHIFGLILSYWGYLILKQSK
jgi:hypothetical protein